MVVWSRLFYDLEPYLTERDEEGARVLAFYHRQLREVAAQEYLLEPAAAAGAGGADGAPAAELERGRPRASSPLGPLLSRARRPCRRRQLDGRVRARSWRTAVSSHRGPLWDDLAATLTDFVFLENKVSRVGVSTRTDAEGKEVTLHTGAFLLLDDYSLALERFPQG